MSADTGPTDDFGRPLTQWGMLALVALECNTVAIGHKCVGRGGDCMEIACVEIHWPASPAAPMCAAHRDEVLRVADVFGGIHVTGRILQVQLRNPPVPDPAVERFAAMELE